VLAVMVMMMVMMVVLMMMVVIRLVAGLLLLLHARAGTADVAAAETGVAAFAALDHALSGHPHKCGRAAPERVRRENPRRGVQRETERRKEKERDTREDDGV